MNRQPEEAKDAEKLNMLIKQTLEKCQDGIETIEQRDTIKKMSEPLDISGFIEQAIKKQIHGKSC